MEFLLLICRAGEASAIIKKASPEREAFKSTGSDFKRRTYR
jgi:hypothetical protein